MKLKENSLLFSKLIFSKLIKSFFLYKYDFLNKSYNFLYMTNHSYMYKHKIHIPHFRWIMETKNRIRTTLNIDKDIMDSIKVIAKNKNSTQTEIINEYLKKSVEAEDKMNKIPSYLIANKKTFNPDKQRKKNMAGIIKGKKPFNAVDLVNSSRRGE